MMTAIENNTIIVTIPQGIFPLAEKYIPDPKTIASVGNSIPIGVETSNIIIIMTPINHRVSNI